MIRIVLLLLLLTRALFAAASMQPQTYELLTQSQTLIEKKNYKKAEQLLKDSLKEIPKNYRYDRAFLEQSLAYLYVTQSKFDKARTHYEKALSFKILPKATQSSIQLTLAQLYLQNGDYGACKKNLDAYLLKKPLNLLVAKLSMALALAQKRYTQALKWCQTAIKLAKIPSKALYKTQKALAVTLQHWDLALETQKILLSRFEITKKGFDALAFYYQKLGKPAQSIAALELSWIQKQHFSEAEAIRLALLFYLQKAPQKGVALLNSYQNYAPLTLKLLETKLQLLYAAKELKHAETTLMELLTRDPSLKRALALARLQAYFLEWDQVITSLAPYKKSPDAMILYATALAQNRRYDEARSIFQAALADKQREKEAQAWLRYLDEF